MSRRRRARVPHPRSAARYRSTSRRSARPELTELVSLCGPEGYVRERIEAFRAAGVTQLNVRVVDPDPARLVEKVKGWL